MFKIGIVKRLIQAETQGVAASHRDANQNVTNSNGYKNFISKDTPL